MAVAHLVLVRLNEESGIGLRQLSRLTLQVIGLFWRNDSSASRLRRHGPECIWRSDANLLATAEPTWLEPMILRHIDSAALGNPYGWEARSSADNPHSRRLFLISLGRASGLQGDHRHDRAIARAQARVSSASASTCTRSGSTLTISGERDAPR
jgi:hypothetical protein